MSLSQRVVFQIFLPALLLGLAACSNGGNSAGDGYAPPHPTNNPPPPANRLQASPTAPLPTDESGAAPPGSGIATGTPFVVIFFPDSNTDYETELAAAIRKAQERKPRLCPGPGGGVADIRLAGGAAGQQQADPGPRRSGDRQPGQPGRGP